MKLITTEKKLRALAEVGDVGIYKTMDGGWGVSLAFYDNSYYLAYPADTIKQAINEMHSEWRVQAALKRPGWNKIAYKKHMKELENYQS